MPFGAVTIFGALNKDFAGVIPPAGGAHLTDKTPPAASIRSCVYVDGVLSVSLDADSETVKAEVLADARPVIVSGVDRFTLPVGELGTGKHEVRIETYDHFLNCTETAYRLSTMAGGRGVHLGHTRHARRYRKYLRLEFTTP